MGSANFASLPAFLGGCFLIAATFLAGCSANPPPRWVEGGAPLVIPHARWDRAEDAAIEIMPNGEVVEDGEVIFVVDRAGRIVDEDREPLAILLPDGHVGGLDNLSLGRVGVANAAPPGGASAWIAIMPNGEVVRFDRDGERSGDGRWVGCDGPSRRTCTLVTHYLAVRHYRNQPRTSVGVGIGIGF